MAILVRHDIARLDVAMHHTPGMGVIESNRSLPKNGKEPGSGHRLRSGQQSFERRSPHQSHGDVGEAIFVAHVINGHDAGVG